MEKGRDEENIIWKLERDMKNKRDKERKKWRKEEIKRGRD